MLGSAHLQAALLTRAQMQGANLLLADLQGASLDDADLQGAVLDRALLQGASLVKVDLRGASLRAVQACRADLRESAMLLADGRDLDTTPLRPATGQFIIDEVAEAITEPDRGKPESEFAQEVQEADLALRSIVLGRLSILVGAIPPEREKTLAAAAAAGMISLSAAGTRQRTIPPSPIFSVCSAAKGRTHPTSRAGSNGE